MHVLMVIAPQDFRDEELREPKAALEKAGHRVTVASTRAGRCVSSAGREVEATLALHDAHAEDFAAIVFVGGNGASCFFDDAVAHRLARELRAQGGVIAAICIAPVTLARAGLLSELDATVFSSEREELTRSGARFVDEPVVTAGHIITANGPRAAGAFGERLVEALSG